MDRKLLALVPSALPNLERFHADATDTPLFSVVVWTANSSGRTRQLALDRELRQLLELQRVQPPEGSRSWFLGTSVVQNGSVTLFSPFDALFVLLDAAWAQRKRFSSIYDLLAGGGNTWLLQLSTLRREAIEKICDLQSVGEEEGVENLYVKVNEEKVAGYLRAKVEKVAKVLATQEKEAAAKAANSEAVAEQVNLPGYLQKAGKKETGDLTTEDLARHYREAIDVVGDYLPEDWVEFLSNEFKVKREVEVKTPAKSASGPQDTFKRFDRRQENGAKRSTPASAGTTTKKSKLANVDRTGMKSMMSFFGKK